MKRISFFLAISISVFLLMQSVFAQGIKMQEADSQADDNYRQHAVVLKIGDIQLPKGLRSTPLPIAINWGTRKYDPDTRIYAFRVNITVTKNGVRKSVSGHYDGSATSAVLFLNYRSDPARFGTNDAPVKILVELTMQYSLPGSRTMLTITETKAATF